MCFNIEINILDWYTVSVRCMCWYLSIIELKNARWNIESLRPFFIVAPCILISSKSFIYQQMHCISVLENIKIYIKTYIKI